MSQPHATAGPGPAGKAAAARTSVSMGVDYWWLWTSSSVSTLGDGLYLTALPLIGSSLTSSPVLLSTVTIAGTSPWLLFSLISGALVDRFDYRAVMWMTDCFRCAVVGLLAIALAVGDGSIGLLAAAAFLLTTGETLYGTASQSMVPRIVSRAPDRLQRANSRLMVAQIMFRDFIGRPLGGVLFGVAGWLPVALDAASFGAGSAIILQARAAGPVATTPGRSLLAEVREGAGWLWRHRLLRTLGMAVCADNLAFTAWSAVLVLMLRHSFHIGGTGFGIMTGSLGVGGVAGSLAAVPLGRRFGMAPVMIAAMFGEGAVTVLLGLSRVLPTAGAALFAIGACAMAWNVITVSLRQSLVPPHLYGRVNSAYRLLALAGAPLGGVLGGLLGNWLGLRAPFLFGGATVIAAGVPVMFIVTSSAIGNARAAVSAEGPP